MVRRLRRRLPVDALLGGLSSGDVLLGGLSEATAA